MSQKNVTKAGLVSKDTTVYVVEVHEREILQKQWGTAEGLTGASPWLIAAHNNNWSLLGGKAFQGANHPEKSFLDPYLCLCGGMYRGDEWRPHKSVKSHDRGGNE